MNHKILSQQNLTLKINSHCIIVVYLCRAEDLLVLHQEKNVRSRK